MKKVRKLQFHREIVNIEFDNAINRPPLFSEVPNRQGGAVWYELYGIAFDKFLKYMIPIHIPLRIPLDIPLRISLCVPLRIPLPLRYALRYAFRHAFCYTLLLVNIKKSGSKQW